MYLILLSSPPPPASLTSITYTHTITNIHTTILPAVTTSVFLLVPPLL